MATSNALSVERGAHDLRVRPEPELTAAQASALRAALDELLAEPAPLVLDLRAMERIDACGLQLLLAFVAARRTLGLACSIDAENAVVRDAVRVSGLGQHLGLDLAEQTIA